MKDDDIFEQTQHELEHSGLPLMEVSRRTGLAYNTVRSIRMGGGNPTIQSLRKIRAVLHEESGSGTCDGCRNDYSHTDVIAEGRCFCFMAYAVKDDRARCASYAPESDGDKDD